VAAAGASVLAVAASAAKALPTISVDSRAAIAVVLMFMLSILTFKKGLPRALRAVWYFTLYIGAEGDLVDNTTIKNQIFLK
jgi:hypothetical protein